jgi:hypothetical protein
LFGLFSYGGLPGSSVEGISENPAGPMRRLPRLFRRDGAPAFDGVVASAGVGPIQAPIDSPVGADHEFASPSVGVNPVVVSGASVSKSDQVSQ